MHRRLRWVAVMLTAARTITLAVAPAAAEPPDRRGGSDRSAVPAGAATVTLLTGDVIEVGVAAPDRFAASVRPGPGRESVTFHTLEVDGTTLVLPTDVVPYVSAGSRTAG